MSGPERSRVAPGSVAAWFVLLLATPLGAQVTTGTTSAGLSYEVRGAGPPVVLIHAFSMDRRMWDDQVAALRDEFRVIRYDLRGHGQSAPPSGPYTGYGDLLELLDHLGIQRASLVGLSAGAELAINFAIAHPDRVDRLVLASPGLGGYAVPPLDWFGPVGQALGAGNVQLAAERWAATPIMALKVNAAAAAQVRAMVVDNAALWTYQRTEQPLAPPAIGRLGEIRAPTLVAVGTADLPHILDVGQLLVAGIPGARRVRLEGAGHLVNLDLPGRFNAELREFLRPSWPRGPRPPGPDTLTPPWTSSPTGW